MPRLTPAELRENSRFARQPAAKEADSYIKRMWSSHALALDQLAEKIERREVAVRAAEGTMPPDDDLLRPIDSTKTVAEVAVPREPNEVSLLKQRLEHLQAAFRMLEASPRPMKYYRATAIGSTLEGSTIPSVPKAARTVSATVRKGHAYGWPAGRHMCL